MEMSISKLKQSEGFKVTLLKCLNGIFNEIDTKY